MKNASRKKLLSLNESYTFLYNISSDFTYNEYNPVEKKHFYRIKDI